MYISLIVLQRSHDFEISITFLRFLNVTSKKRKKSRFLDFQKNIENVFSNYGLRDASNFSNLLQAFTQE